MESEGSSKDVAPTPPKLAGLNCLKVIWLLNAVCGVVLNSCLNYIVIVMIFYTP